jgi:hypothetical protein
MATMSAGIRFFTREDDSTYWYPASQLRSIPITRMSK